MCVCVYVCVCVRVRVCVCVCACVCKMSVVKEPGVYLVGAERCCRVVWLLGACTWSR